MESFRSVGRSLCLVGGRMVEMVVAAVMWSWSHGARARLSISIEVIVDGRHMTECLEGRIAAVERPARRCL